jgi:uncharacterized phage protein gp47/JayE
VSFVARTYDDIVRDLLTTLTGGVVRERVMFDAATNEAPLTKLSALPVRRVSHLARSIPADPARNRPASVQRFTASDFEVLPATETSSARIAFRPARAPKESGPLDVNYYPVETRPTPLTDINVGSVVRTIVESFGREISMLYQQLAHVYDSAFVETAEGSSLDKVVALVGVERLAAGHPVARVVVTRNPAASGRVTVAANTPLVTPKGDRYLLVTEVTLEPGERVRTATARGESPRTPVVGRDELRQEVLVAGVSDITNPEPARLLDVPEPDEELRRRARRAFVATARGTLDALRSGVLAVDGVRDVIIVEHPDGLAGTIRVTVAYSTDTPVVRAAVETTIRELRPAGIRVLTDTATPLTVDVDVDLVVAGDRPPSPSEVAELREGVRERLVAHLSGLAAGGRARRAQLARVALDDPRLVDAVITLVAEGGSPVAELDVPAGRVIAVGDVDVAVTSERGVPAEPATIEVHAPIHLVGTTTASEAVEALTARVGAHLATRSTDAPLTADGLIAAMRDDTRYAIVRADVVVTAVAADRFFQLTDGLGSFSAPTGSMTLRSIEAPIVDGTV